MCYVVPVRRYPAVSKVSQYFPYHVDMVILSKAFFFHSCPEDASFVKQGAWVVRRGTGFPNASSGMHVQLVFLPCARPELFSGLILAMSVRM